MRALAAFTSGQPALVEVPVGRGKVIAAAFRPDEAETSLPREPAFVVFMHAAVTYLSGIRPALPQATCGRAVTVRIEPAAYARRWTISADARPASERRGQEKDRRRRQGRRRRDRPRGIIGGSAAVVRGRRLQDRAGTGAASGLVARNLPVRGDADGGIGFGAGPATVEPGAGGQFQRRLHRGADALSAHLVSLRPGRPLAGSFALLLMALLLLDGLWCATRPRSG